MKFFAHRINTINELKNINNEFGIELDLRDKDNNIIIQHDPFISDGTLFEEYIKYLDNRDIILNIKSERIEYKVLEILNNSNYKGSYFFLDSSFPMIYNMSNKGIKDIALRYSEYEGIDTLINMKDKVKWIWVDVFTILPLTYKICKKIKYMNYNICLVSPELQGREYDIENYANIIKQDNLIIDAICCKVHNIDKWKSLL